MLLTEHSLSATMLNPVFEKLFLKRAMRSAVTCGQAFSFRTSGT
jgi:hypothetical protein